MEVKQRIHRPVTRLARMINGFNTEENRRYPRAKVKWPIVMAADDRLVDGRTQNLSLGGAFIRCSELPTPDSEFRLVITTKDRLIPATAELVWSDVSHSQDKSVVHGMGVRFTRISNDDRSFLRGVLRDHL